MVAVVLGLIFLVAVAAWGVALWSLLQLMRITPAGQKLNVWFMVGFFRFARIKEIAGEAAEPILRRYTIAWGAFFLTIVLAAAASILIAIEQEEGRGAPADAASQISS